MTQQEKRIKIAEACGWSGCQMSSYGILVGFNPNPNGLNEVPDYFGSLDAMHEAEEVLNFKQWQDYQLIKLPFICSRMRRSDKRFPWQGSTEHASADQRAEAFGLTLKLW